MIIKEMFYIPIKLKPELSRVSMTTSDVNNQFPTAINLTQIKFTKKNSTMLYFLLEALARFIQNVLQSTFLYANKTTKKCIQFLNIIFKCIKKNVDIKRTHFSKRNSDVY
jgi:hypothetical protein